MPDPPERGDDELIQAWRLLMNTVLEQRLRWPEVSAKLGLTQAGLRALLAIDPHEPRSMRDLARVLNCDASYVTAMVDDLESAGYARRVPADHDRRIKNLALTDAGIAALEVAEDGLFTVPPKLLQMSPTRRRTFAAILRTALSD